MQMEYLIELSDAVIAVKDAKGHIKLNQFDQYHGCRCGHRYLLGSADWSDFLDAAGWRRGTV
jgi:hypothetical protein